MAQKRKSTSSTGRAASDRSSASARKKTAAGESARRQTTAIILFAVTILLFCIMWIPGGSLWGWMHRLMLGLFGICAYIAPVFVAYLGVISAKERTVGSMKVKLWQCIVLVVLLDSVIEVFRQDAFSVAFLPAMKQAFANGNSGIGGGCMGELIGYPMERLFTDTGAKIILFLLIAVFLMLVTGTTVKALLHLLWKPVEKTKETIETAMETAMAENERAAEEEKENEKAASPSPKRSKIDIELGTGYPDDKEPAEEDIADKKERLRRAAAKVAAEEPTSAAESASATTPAQPVTVKPTVDLEEAAVSFAAEAKAGAAAAHEEENRYNFPPLSLLDEPKSSDDRAAAEEQTATADLLIQTLKDFGVSAKVVDISRGPTVTRYEVMPSAGVKISRITGLSDDIALRLAATGVRVEAIPNKAAIGIEVPNRVTNSVCLRSLIDTKVFREAPGKLTVALGKDIAGQTVLADLAKMPHLLIAGTTGSGKSVCTNSMIQSVLFRATPDEVKMVLIDPKRVEFGVYNGVPHLLVPVVTDPRKAAGALGWAVMEMMNRYQMFSDNGVRDLSSYNELARNSETLRPLPQILIVIDELADLMMVAANAVESNICRLAQMARAAGMHLVIATQRPSVDIITGLIKANIPSRLALTVASAVDSRTILDASGAEKLLGKGDMLFMPVGYAKPQRVQGCFVSNREIAAVIDFLKANNEEDVTYDESIQQEIEKQAQATEKTAPAGSDDEDTVGGDGDDDLFSRAVEVALESGQASTSMLQRRLRVGYARAGRLIDEMEQRGIVGPYEGSKPRQLLVNRQQWMELNATRPDGE